MSTEFKRPAGIFLQGGGALGAWQAAALEVLVAQGLRFDAVMGFSIGAVNGTALAFDRLPEALARWRDTTGGTLRLLPRLHPFALCSSAPLRACFEVARDEQTAKASLRSELTIVSACAAEGAPINARFTPKGRDGWDGPLLEHAVASCAIPLVFPPVDVHYRGRLRRLIDGGVPMPAPLDFSPLAGCADLLVLEMIRADEFGRRWRTPWRSMDQRGREACRELVEAGLNNLLRLERPPRVFRLAPSIRLEPMMLDFRAAGLSEMLALGAADAKSFLSGPELFRVR